MKRAVGCAGVWLLSLCLFLTACANKGGLVSTQHISDYLNSKLTHKETLCIQPNPAYTFQVPMTVEVLDAFRIDAWEKTEKPQNATFDQMLYFDVPHNFSSLEYTRVALFSNGYILTQWNDGTQFLDEQWYVCVTGSSTPFDRLINTMDAIAR